MGKVHEVFPMIVYQGDIDCHNEFKEKYLVQFPTQRLITFFN